MTNRTAALAGIALGVGTMYLIDPATGRRRRARLRDVTVHTGRIVGIAAGTTLRDVEHRAHGLAARARAAIADDPIPDDAVLAARVRARLGRLVSHPGAMEVAAHDGVVTLSGPVFDAEVGQLLDGVAAVRGVRAVENRLDSHPRAGNVSALQGPGPLKVTGWAARCGWTPTRRLVAGLAGLALLALSAPDRRVRGAVTGIAGAELLARAVGRAG
jgi:hypothetical protein